MKKILFFIFFCSFIYGKEILGTWFKEGKSHYSYEVYTFFKKGSQIKFSKSQLYPNKNLRTELFIGEYNPNTQLALADTKTYIENRHKGIFSPFLSKGIFSLDKKKEIKIEIEEVKDSIKINGSVYKNYKNELLDAITNLDANKLMRLYQFNILHSQSKVKDFGGMNMASVKNQNQNAIISGYETRSFEGRGGGLGVFAKNPGLSVTFNAYEEFFGIKLYGEFFGGKIAMEGLVMVTIDDKKSFSIKYDNVKISKGIASNGYYIIGFIKEKKNKNVDFSVLGQ